MEKFGILVTMATIGWNPRMAEGTLTLPQTPVISKIIFIVRLSLTSAEEELTGIGSKKTNHNHVIEAWAFLPTS